MVWTTLLSTHMDNDTFKIVQDENDLKRRIGHQWKGD